MAKTIEEKMAHPAKPQVKILKESRGTNFPAGKMLIATPQEIDKWVRRIPSGKVLTVNQLREDLASEYDADYTCPLTTGIFLRLVAENAEQNRARGVQPIAPYWRVVQGDGSLNPKLPGGLEFRAQLLQTEGHRVRKKGSKWFVDDF